LSDKITIQIVGWNSEKELPSAMRALKKVPSANYKLRYIDNNSSDRSVEIVKSAQPDADIIELSENKGFGAAHNIGFGKCDTELIMIHNPDLIVNWSGVMKVKGAFSEESVGAAQGLLYRSKPEEETKIIDSAGISMSLALNGYDRGAGEVDTGQYDKAEEVSAVTGAAGVYRMEALRSIAYGGREIFDEDFFAYKEDVDLGWRLRLAGWKNLYVPVLQGWHGREIRKERAANYLREPQKFIKKLTSERTKYGIRNWLWMNLKNAKVKDALKHELFVDLRLLLICLIGLIYWPWMIALVETIAGMPKMVAKRSMNKRV